MRSRLSRTEREAVAADEARRAPLVRTIDLREVRALFQPVVRLVDGATIGYEALARMGERGDLPGPWFHLAREVGLDTELELACLAAVADRGLPPGDALLFVNVSPATLVQPRMAELCGPLADRLVVELTEHIEVRDYDALRPALERWSSRGVRLAVDDTGAGYSTFRHVLELAPQFLKLDRTVIGGLDDHPARRALVAALVLFADEVGTTIIAEGVERWEEAEALRDVGVHLAQGFVFGRPEEPWQPARWPSAEEGDELQRRLAAARDVHGASAVVCDHLAESAGLLSSVYLERDGLLRCAGQQGYWQVLDGIPTTRGVMARAFRDGRLAVVDDVTLDPDFIEAMPDVQSQCAVPLCSAGSVVGVLNVEASRPLLAGDIDLTAAAADALSEWMDRRWQPPTDSPLERLGRTARGLAGLADESALEESLVRLACEVAGMSSAVLIRPGPLDMLERRTAHGPLALAFYALSTAELHRLRSWVATVSSAYTGELRSGRTLPFTEKLRVAGVGALAVVPVPSVRGDEIGMLAVADADARRIHTPDIEALELLVAEAARALDLAQTVEELRDRAARDPLTGLGNHRAFHDAVRSRMATTEPWAVLMADLDGFKAINARHGHLEGDRVLREAAAAMAQALRGGDRLFRVGGDEFAGVLTGSDPVAAEGLAQRLAQAADPVLRPYGASVSIGVAVPAAGEPVAALLERVDAALYGSKRERHA